MSINSKFEETPLPSKNNLLLIDLISILWQKRKVLLKFFISFTLFGLLIAITTPKQYVASTVIVPQLSDNRSTLGGLSNIAAMAGINLSNANVGSIDLSPKVYPKIIEGIGYQQELINTPIFFDRYNKSMSILTYFTQVKKPTLLGVVKKYTIGLPGTIINALRGKDKSNNIKKPSNSLSQVHLNPEEQAVINQLDDIMSMIINEKDGYILLSCKMPDATAAADLTFFAQSLLQKYITIFKIQKVQANQDFIQQRYDQAKQDYEQLQYRLAIARDRNKNISTEIAKSEIDRLNGEFSLKYGVYSELAKQLEQAKIKVKEETPVLTVIKPVVTPREKSEPQRLTIITMWMIFGLIVGVGFVLGKNYLKNIKATWLEYKGNHK